jgi:hypothetical protein
MFSWSALNAVLAVWSRQLSLLPMTWLHQRTVVATTNTYLYRYRPRSPLTFALYSPAAKGA